MRQFYTYNTYKEQQQSLVDLAAEHFITFILLIEKAFKIILSCTLFLVGFTGRKATQSIRTYGSRGYKIRRIYDVKFLGQNIPKK